jgi:hypothetical protein
MGRVISLLLSIAILVLIVVLLSKEGTANASTPTPSPMQLAQLATATQPVLVVTNTLTPTSTSTATALATRTPVPTGSPTNTVMPVVTYVTATPSLVATNRSVGQAIPPQVLDTWLADLRGKSFRQIRTTLEQHQGALCPAENPAQVEFLTTRPTIWPVVVIVCRPNRQEVNSLFGFLILNEDGEGFLFEFGEEESMEYDFALTRGELMVGWKELVWGSFSSSTSQITVIQFEGDHAPPRHQQG